MPLPDALARFNRVVTNPLARPLASRVPPMAVVVHEGRRSGRIYRTPVLAFPTDHGFAIPLTYGPDSDWVHNVMRKGGCRLERAGEEIRLREARIVTGDRAMRLVPIALRSALRGLGVPWVLRLDRT